MKYIITTNKPLCLFDIITYDPIYGQWLSIEEKVNDKEYVASIISSNEDEILDLNATTFTKDNKLQSIFECDWVKIYSVLNSKKEDLNCNSNTKVFNILNIENL